MATDINSVFLIGRLTRDPELSTLPNSNTSIAKFSLASNRVFNSAGEKKDQTSFFNCIAWGKLGEVIVEYCRKGQQIAIEGRLQQRTWEDTNGNKRSTVEIVVENCQFLSKPSGGADHADRGKENYPEPPVQNFDSATPFTDDDIPF